MKALNLVLAFALELAVLAAGSYWGFTREAALAVRVLAGIGAPLVLGAVWGVLGAPKSARRLRSIGRGVLLVLWFGAGVIALIAAGRPFLALVLAVLTVINHTLFYVWPDSKP